MRKLDDIIPPSRRSAPPPPPQQDMPPVGRPVAPRPMYNRRPRFPLITLLVVLVVVVGSVGALYYFSGAKVEVTPSALTTTVQNSFTATQGSGDLPFEVVSAQKIATQSVAGTGTKTVNSSASGTITVYNTQSKSQRLIANTRFASPSGLIFRIHSAITIPAGSADKPGSVTATVYADQAGDSYNIGPSSFTVPGLAGTPQAAQVYARSAAAMTGGASGTIPVVDSATEASAVAALQSALASDLQNALADQVPDGYILLPGSATTTFQELTPAASATAGMVDLKEQGTVSAAIFPSTLLAKAIASSAPGLGYNGEPLVVASSSDLKLSSVGALPTSSSQSFTFTLAGTAELTYVVDSSRIAAAVAGKSRAAAQLALTNYPEVKRAILVLRPFWRSSFPADPSSITVVVDAP